MAAAGLVVRAQLTATVPVKPPTGVIVTVEVVLNPGDETVADEPVSVNAAGTTIVRGTVAVSATPPELPVTVAV
jgi:hypothetical protein